MEQEINVMIFYVSSTVIVALIGVLAWYLYTHKKREGISYRLAIYKITSFAKQQYNREDAIEQSQEIGQFGFGSTTIVLVPAAGPTIPDLDRETPVRMGEDALRPE